MRQTMRQTMPKVNRRKLTNSADLDFDLRAKFVLNVIADSIPILDAVKIEYIW